MKFFHQAYNLYIAVWAFEIRKEYDAMLCINSYTFHSQTIYEVVRYIVQMGRHNSM